MRKYGLCLAAAVLTLAVGCGGGGGGGGTTISLNGGAGDDLIGIGIGGNGGSMGIEVRGMKGIQILRSGTVDTSFPLPSDPATGLGSAPLVVASDLGIMAYANQAAAQAAVVLDGTPYMYISGTNNNRIWIRHPSTSDEIVTGIRVEYGATLTLGLNVDSGGLTGQDGAQVRLASDLDVRGILTVKDLTTGTVGGAPVDERHGTTANSRDKGYLYLYLDRNLLLHRSGLISTAGADAPPGTDQRGGDGGFLHLYGTASMIFHGTVDASGGDGDGDGDGGNACFYSGTGFSDSLNIESINDHVIVTGTMDASGGDGTVAGSPGGVAVSAERTVRVTGLLVADGGSATGAVFTPGAQGGTVTLWTSEGGIYNSGTLRSNGGYSASGGGAPGGDVNFYAANISEMGLIYHSGAIETLGGDSDVVTAGNGGCVYFSNYGGDIRISGSITADGGSAAAVCASGGSGGAVEIYNYENSGASMVAMAPGDVILSGSISLDGGDGENGGTGGSISIQSVDYEQDRMFVPDYGVKLIGYSRITASGGSGPNGGDGGAISLFTDGTDDGFGFPQSGAGPITVETDVDCSGGDASSGSGGDGGILAVDSLLGASVSYYDGSNVCACTGTFTFCGGNGTLSGGRGGGTYALLWDGTSVNATINIDGGDATDPVADAPGGDAGFIWYLSGADMYIGGTVNACGGRAMGTGAGGQGGSTEGMGLTTALGVLTSRMTYNLRGGDGDALVGTGGEGGRVLLDSSIGTDHAGSWDVSGGQAFIDGVDGVVEIDGILY
ncbi:MAG: hypothetical protein JW909_07920 [Planctomycetes bacterium]|nr:hypothetical protein [Planctomycetota bacterium]